MKNTHQVALQMGVNLFAAALVVYEMYVGFSYGISLFQNNHLSMLIAVLFAAFPLFTIMAMAFLQMGTHTRKTHVVLISFCALVVGLAVQWFFQYGFMNNNLATKQSIAVQNSSQMQAHQSKLASIETTLKANEKYATVDLAGVDANVALKRKKIEQIQATKCPDWDCKQDKPKQVHALESELAELEGQRNGAKAYKEALDARTAAFQAATTIHATIGHEDAFIANVAVLMGYPREQAYHAFSILYASFMISLFLVLTFFSSVRSELESIIEEKRVRTPKEKPIQEDEPLQLTEQLIESNDANQDSVGFFQKAMSADYFNRRQQIHVSQKLSGLNKPLAFQLGEQVIDIESASHILTAGSTGEGKSSSARAMLTQIIEKNSPNDLEIVGIDLKDGLELGQLNKLPHLIKPVAETLDKATSLIDYVYNEMMMRFKILKENEVEKIQSLDQKIPFLLLVIDEGSELSASMKKLTLIVEKGRAAGVHVWFSTQYPLKADFGSKFMANIPVRIVHYLQSPDESRAVLGHLEKGKNANDLPSAGYAIYQAKRTREIIKTKEITFNDFKSFVNQQADKYSKQPISEPAPAPKKTAFVNEGLKTSCTPTKVVFAPLQQMQPVFNAKAQINDFGDNVVPFPNKMQPDATCNLSVAFNGNLALKPEENQQGCTATDLQPVEVAKNTVQPDKSQQNQQGCNATPAATAQFATLQPTTFKVQPPVATAQVRELVDWALKEMDNPKSDQAISDFIFENIGRKINKGSVNLYRNELQAKKEK